MTQAAEGVAAEGALQDLPVFGAIKKRSPLLQFSHAFGSFLGVELCHAPVIEQFAAAHGVAKMSAPVVGEVYVGHRRGDSSLRHNGMRLAEERFANYSDLRALGKGSQRRPQSRPAGADDQYIVFVSFIFCRHKSLKSL